MKVYRLTSYSDAIDLLRPGALYQILKQQFVRWDDPRPIPTREEIEEVMGLTRKFEDSLNTIYSKEDIKRYKKDTTIIFDNCIDGFIHFKHLEEKDLDHLQD